MENRNKLIERITEELKDLPFLLARSAAGDREEDVKKGYNDAMDTVAVSINHLVEQAANNIWGDSYINALLDMQKRLGFKGTTRELLTDETRLTTKESSPESDKGEQTPTVS